MNKLFKKLLCSAVAASMALGTLVLPVMAEDVSALPPNIEVNFDDSANYTLHGATLEESSYGKSLAVSSGKYADINDVSAINSLTGDFTFAVLLNPSTDAQWTRAYDIGTGTDSYIFLAPSSSFGAGQPRFVIKSAATKAEQALQGTKTLNVGEWNSVVVYRESGTTKMYVNGELAGETTDITYDPKDAGATTQNWLGRSQYSADPYFTGLIDDFRVYNSALNGLPATYDELAKSYEAVDAVAKRKQLIYDNNCFIAETHFEYEGAELYALTGIPSGMYVTDKSVTDNAASFTLNGYENTDISNITAYAAEYNGGSLVKITSSEIDTDNFTGEVSIPYTKANADDTVKLVVWADMQPVPESKPEDITATVSVKNYTTDSGRVSAQVYAVGGSASSGAETLIDGAAAADTFNSLDEKELTINVPVADIPAGTSKLIVKLTTPTGEDTETATAATLYKLASAPVAAPADSNETTNGAHDPSIVKFPDDDTYYVYSSHHLIFTSEDLINWKKYDFTNLTTNPDYYDKDSGSYPNKGKTQILTDTFSFIHDNIDTNVNGTYWAPDVIYNENDLHPYWMYISVSCGLGGRNSAISLIKSDSPLFWADRDAQTIDCGVVYATKDTNEYKTNSIDANIYFDSSDNNKPYFIWGSFWGGIQAAPLTDEGYVSGIDYTSDSTILNTAKNFGTSIFTQKRGVAGPEGAWMIEHGDYRYAFTSYAWLGSNYHTRVARAPLSKTFGTDTGTQLLDANGTVMGSEYSRSTGAVKKEEITGYKLIGSYRLGDGSTTIAENNANDWYYPREAGDAHIYYGPGHNSVINVGDETFYVSHTRKDAVEGAATLQVRKLLWTSDGWPVVSPVTYAGEKEQKLPKSMLSGTYDLSSVGVTKLAGSDTTINENWTNHSGNRNYDLPILSSKVTLNNNSSMTVTNSSGAQIGTWEFDGDHTVTLKFTASGDESKDEYYKSGDTMTMYALYGYDKDEAEPVIALTGTNQNHVTQFAKKSAVNVYKTTPKAIGAVTPIVLEKSRGGNPELGFDGDGNILYGGDPAATVIGDTVYLIVGHDTATGEGYNMPNWALYTSKNMTDWEYKGIVLDERNITWTNDNSSAWASQMVEHNGKYYLYYCAETSHSTYNGKSIGVAVAEKPEGPYVDKGSPLVVGSFTEPSTSNYNDIDPTVWIETVDGVEHRYLAWGNGKYYICELNDDMISVKDRDGDGSIVMHKDIRDITVKSLPGGDWFTEAPWIYRRQDSEGNYYGKYYLFFAKNWREEMAYAMADDLFGRYDYIQTIMPPTATSNTNHPSVIDFNGKTYFIYHNGALPHGSGFRRSVCIQELEFDENGYVYPLTETSIGLTGTASVIKTSDNKYLGHDAFRNPSADGSYPLSVPVTVSSEESEYNTAWEIVPAKAILDFPAVEGGESIDNYVSIQSVDKPGLYISVSGSKVTLTQDADGNQANNMTFRTVQGLDGKDGSVSFESVSEPGKYLTALNKSLMLSYGSVPADASFTIGAVTAKPDSVVSVAEREADPQPEADITQDFNSASTGSLIHLAATETPAYTALNGVTLYIGTRSSGQDTSQNFSIQSGGVTGNALVLNAGAYQSASRGGRMAINTPTIPNGYTVTAEIKVKQGVSGSELRFNDSTSSETGTSISGLSTDWQTFKVTITNDDDVYTRTIMLGDTVLATDYVNTFPVLWGTTGNKTSQSIYFDDLTIKTTTASGETPTITLPDPAAKFTFDGNLTDAISNGIATLTGSKANETTTSMAAYVAGASGEDDDKAISFTGAGSYGVELPIKPNGGNYTISFDANITASEQYSPIVFLMNYDSNGDAKTEDSNAQWISIASQGWKTTMDDGPMIWSRDVTGGNAWNDLVSDNNKSLSLNTWHNITVVATGATGKIYVDKQLVASGNIANIIDSTTKMFLAVNYWNTPFNGAIDNLMLFNQALSASQVALIGAE